MLTTNRVTYGDAGQYKCSAKNSEGKNEAAFHITVTGKRWLNFVSFSCSSYFLTFFFLVFHTFTFFELCFWILCPGPPEINPELKNQSVSYNSSLQFRCSLSGFPTPEILWTKDGVNLDKKKHCYDSSSEIGRLWSIHLQRQKQRRKQKLNFLDRSGGRYGSHLHIERTGVDNQFRSLVGWG